MNYTFTIMKKELYRVFSDKKMMFSLFVLPAILVIGIYALMGQLVTGMMKDQENHVATVVIVNAPNEVRDYIENNEAITRYEVEYDNDISNVESYKDRIYTGDLDLIVEFDNSFISDLSDVNTTPDIKTYYNPSEDYSNNARSGFIAEFLNGYREQKLIDIVGSREMLAVFTIDADNEESVIQDDDKAMGKMLGSIIPYIITILLFAGAMSLGVDTFAGEKERGTMASMLIAPIKRSDIVYGKLLALMILSGLSALIYGGSMILAMPLMANMAIGGNVSADLSGIGIVIGFNPIQILMLLAVIVSLVFVYVALIALPAVFAKDVKVGSTYVMPIYMIVMISGMMTMFLGENAKLYEYAVPLYGSAIALKNIFTTDITVPAFALTIVGNLIFGMIMAYIITKAFNSEKVMFDA